MGVQISIGHFLKIRSEAIKPTRRELIILCPTAPWTDAGKNILSTSLHKVVKILVKSTVIKILLLGPRG